MDVSTAATSSLFGLDEPLCPYTGLRTFTEDEAIYFRGRESHIAKCLALLMEQRFVMITGASGDGKSSLVFAGMLPEVRAGFVPARYSRWAVATFRPERSPLHNLAQALAPALGLPDSSSSVETGLEQGFSALVQLYQASKLCPPASHPAGLTTDEQRQQQRQAANLLLVVDQFEEFFTNPENYDGDQPNTAAQTVVNLLLETARLAQAQNLPIYIVCTMRSDFVGQCAEFRGLIEQVGASQYFVPRLLRHEFQEVIKGPALLSGNRISERLVQRLLYDIGQGQDQLPVLQHALRRIWLAANQGREEMDLIHYAMVGGLSDALPVADQPRFDAWRATLPAHQQQFLLGTPGLRNVLDAHANQLYFEANDRYNRDFQPPLPPGTAERVIEQTFRVLTRTDGKRVVRNRVTGAQLTAILKDEALPWPVVCRILRPFREEGTTFLGPFLSADADGRAVLPPEAVLDISHESLIRNWNHLAEWAHHEALDVRTATDFRRQASRWQENAESPGYLLPIGLYTFFSSWYAKKPGADGWLAHYHEASPEVLTGQEPAATQVGALKRYLETSRRHLWSELLAARYGVWRLTAAILLPILLVGAGWWWWSQRVQQSDYVAGKMVQTGLDEMSKIVLRVQKSKADRLIVKALMERGSMQMHNDSLTAKEKERGETLYDSCYEVLLKQVPGISATDAADFVLTVHRLKDILYNPWFGSPRASDYAFPQMLNALQDDTLALNIELSMYASVDNTDYDLVERENPLTQPILRDLVSRLAQASITAKAARKGNTPITQKQRRVAVLTARTVMALSYYLNNDSLHRSRAAAPLADLVPHRAARQGFRKQRKQLLRTLRDYVQQEIKATTGQGHGAESFELCLRVLLGQGTNTPQELDFLNGVSPLDSKSAPQFERLLNNRNEGAGAGYYPNRGYLTAAMVFAALQRPDKVYRCVDSARYYNCTALLPYLVKYGVLNANNAHKLLAKCAQTSNSSFNELYAATVYGLLSVEPGKGVLDESETLRARMASAGNVPPDLVSFSLPVAVRDKAWVALTGATAEIASQESLFTEQKGYHQTAVQAGYPSQLKRLFLTTFLTKMHGVYLAEIKQLPLESAQSFSEFSTLLASLQQQLAKSKSAPQLDYSEWKMLAPQVPDYSKPKRIIPNTDIAVVQSKSTPDPITFLQLPMRPRTSLLGDYYTCSFDSFFLYELQHESLAARPDAAVVQLLDSLAFQEVIVPDHFSDASSTTDFAGYNAVNRSAKYVPNLVWIKAIANTNIPANRARQQGNALLASIEVGLQDRKKLRDSAFTHGLVRNSMRSLIKSKPSIKSFSWLPLAVAFSDLAAALAHEGQLTEAFEVVNFMEHKIDYGFFGSMLSPATKIRICEQAMLINNQSAHGVVDGFLLKSLADNQAGDITVDPAKPSKVPANMLTVCFWRPIATQKTDVIPLLAQSLTYRLNNQQLVAGLYAPFKAYGLADDLYKANEEVINSPFRSGVTPFRNITYALLGYAHLTTPQPNVDWREYDEAALIRPADYLGFASCND